MKRKKATLTARKAPEILLFILPSLHAVEYNRVHGAAIEDGERCDAARERRGT